MGEKISRALQRSRDDTGAFSTFYREHADTLVRYFMVRTGDAEVSLDLTAEVMARAFTKRSSYRGETDLSASAWLYTIASRQLSTFRRRKKVEQKALRRLGLERTEPIPDAEIRMVERDTLEELLAGLGAGLSELTPAQREVVELRFFEGLSYADIAIKLGIGEGAARGRVMRAMEVLRKAVGAAPKDKQR